MHETKGAGETGTSTEQRSEAFPPNHIAIFPSWSMTEMEGRPVIGRVLLFCSEEKDGKGARGYERTLIAARG